MSKLFSFGRIAGAAVCSVLIFAASLCTALPTFAEGAEENDDTAQVRISEEGAAEGYDLIVSSLKAAPTKITAGNRAKLVVAVTNIGTDEYPAGAGVSLGVKVDGVEYSVDAEFSKAVPAGGTAIIEGQSDYTAVEGSHVIRASVTPSIGGELISDNNSKTTRITVLRSKASEVLDPAFIGEYFDDYNRAELGVFENGRPVFWASSSGMADPVIENGSELVLNYQSGGWFGEGSNITPNNYDYLVIRMKGAQGGEERDFTLRTSAQVENDEAGIRFDRLIGHNGAVLPSITTDYQYFYIDLRANNLLNHPEHDYNSGFRALHFNFMSGVSGTLYIDEIFLTNFKPVENSGPLEPPVGETPSLAEVLTADAAEAQISGGLNKGTGHNGYTGLGFVENITHVGDTLTFELQSPESGKYDMKIRYANASSDQRSKNLNLYVNNGSAEAVAFPYIGAGSVSDPGSDYWNSWGYVTVPVTLHEGNNTITFRMDDQNGGNVNIDSITLSKRVERYIASFAFLRKNNPQLPFDVYCKIGADGNITATLPSTISTKSLIPTYVISAGGLFVDNKLQVSGNSAVDFTEPVYYTAVSNGEAEHYLVTVKNTVDSKLPNVMITLDENDPNGKYTLFNGTDAADKEVRVRSTVTIQLGAQSEVLGAAEGAELAEIIEQPAEVKLRGNSTLANPQKGYKIKLDNKCSVLDMPKNKHWVLIPSYDDKSLMRNYIGYSIGKHLDGLDWTPTMRFAHVFIDGEYMGVYMLGEHLRLDSNRVDIAELDETSTNITGGYILEQDQRQDAAYIVHTGGYHFALDTPEEPTAEQFAYINQYMSDFIRSLDNPRSGEYKQYIDVDSFVDWYLNMEIMKTLDASGWSSIYLHKDADGPLHMGPVWDFDISSGNTNYQDPAANHYWIRYALWYGKLFEDPDFANAVRNRWNELRETEFYQLPDRILATKAYLDDASRDHFGRYDILQTYVWPDYDIYQTYDAQVEAMRSWMDDRIAWLDSQYGN